MEPTLNIVVLLTKDVNMSMFMRPYELQQGLTHSITGTLMYEKLEQEQHYRAAMYMEVAGITQLNGAEVEAMSCTSTVEAVFTLTTEDELSPEALEDVVVYRVGPTLLGQIRVNLSQVSLMTGVQPVVLPPLDPSNLRNLLVSQDAPTDAAQDTLSTPAAEGAVAASQAVPQA